MPRTTDFLTNQRAQITKRLEELRPLYEEYLTLERAQEALDQLGEPVRRARRRGPGRPPGSRNRARRKATKRRRTGGTRAEHTLKAIRANPGVTIPELADTLKIRPNYLYRVTAQLQKERQIKKRGREFYPA
jgi:hypothetical protein